MLRGELTGVEAQLRKALAASEERWHQRIAIERQERQAAVTAIADASWQSWRFLESTQERQEAGKDVAEGNEAGSPALFTMSNDAEEKECVRELRHLRELIS